MAVLNPSQAVVLIAAYNEEKNISGVVRQIRAMGHPVIVVDDGSKDDTASVLKGLEGVEVWVSAQNEGKGAALRKGIVRFLEREEAVLLMMDADGQHDPEEIRHFLETLAVKGTSFVIGNRMKNPKGMPWIRRATNRFMSFLISCLTGQNIPDTQCGFRTVRREALSRMVLQTTRFEIESEMLLEAGRLGLRVHSIPIRSVYEGHASRIHPVKDTIRFISFLFGYYALPKRSNETK